MALLCDSTLCTACGACLNACPFDAIAWRTDVHGEPRPAVNAARCRDCGVCGTACPQMSPETARHAPLESHACWLQDEKALARCSSGGAAHALGAAVLAQGGIVFGCAYTEGECRHIRVATDAELALLAGSKYVWSDVGHAFRDIRQELADATERPVLFIGTPCQVDGLRKFLKTAATSPRLFTADLICHGTPPPNYIRDFLRQTEGDEPETLTCRDRNGVALHGTLKDGRAFHHTGGFACNAYLEAYIRGLTYRERCYTCPYAVPQRIGDLTLGDYWGIPRRHLPPDAPEPLSIVYVNTPQGKRLLQLAAPRLACHPVPVDEAVAHKTNMNRPQTRPPERDLFLKELPAHGVVAAIHKALAARDAWPRRLRHWIGRLLRKIFRKST